MAPVRLRELIERLAAARVGYIVVGGLAVNAWGHLRGTRDLDIVPELVMSVARGELDDVPPIAAVLEPGTEARG